MNFAHKSYAVIVVTTIFTGSSTLAVFVERFRGDKKGQS
jgi:hypothetical protein